MCMCIVLCGCGLVVELKTLYKSLVLHLSVDIYHSAGQVNLRLLLKVYRVYKG
jgi:hypothetical protein